MPDRPPLSRRSVVGGALGVVAVAGLSGCDSGDDLPTPGASASGSGSASADPTPTSTAAAATGDAAIVTETVDRLSAALGVIAAARRLPRLRRPLAGLARAHEAHLAALEGERSSGSGAPLSQDASTALASVRDSETALQAALVDAAGRAESGALARLLASASASVTQHLATLPGTPA